MAKRKIPEDHYRASRICRILGNPTAYEILHLLRRNRRKPNELARELGVTISTVSHVLKNLRNLDLIRYDVKYKERIYWIKEETIIAVVDVLNNLIKKVKTKDY